MNEIAEPPTETQALQRVDNSQKSTIVDLPKIRELTPQQARNESIANTLDAAYAKASMLQLSPEEAQKLAADFPDEDIRTGARGDDKLIYLEHAAVRRRMLEVFGPGQWTIINRRSWLDEGAGWLYADIVLVCRGCFVGECIGASRYSSKNARTNYADAVKGAESDALGRIAGTALGVGLQLWSKGFSGAWYARNRAPQRSQTAYTAQPDRTYQKANVERKEVVPAADPNGGSTFRTVATPASVLPAQATEKTREWAWNGLIAEFGPDVTWKFIIGKGWAPNSAMTYDEWNLGFVPISKQALAVLADEIRKTVEVPSEPEKGKLLVDEHLLPDDFGSAIITVPRREQRRDEYLKSPDTIQSLYSAMKAGDAEAQRRLFGMARGWNPEPFVDRTGKKWPIKPEDAECRVSLDQFLDYIEAKGENKGA